MQHDKFRDNRRMFLTSGGRPLFCQTVRPMSNVRNQKRQCYRSWRSYACGSRLYDVMKFKNKKTGMSSPFTAEMLVEDYLHGVRVDRFLLKHFRNYTRFRMQRMVRAGQAGVDGKRVQISQRVFRGQTVSVRLIEPPDKLLEPESLPLEILFEDEWLLVVNKHAGQVAHPVANYQTGTLVNALQFHLDRQSPLPGLLRPGIVHRLDRLTSGVMVIAKDHLSHRRLSIQFQQYEVSKSYLVLVEGRVENRADSIDLPI